MRTTGVNENKEIEENLVQFFISVDVAVMIKASPTPLHTIAAYEIHYRTFSSNRCFICSLFGFSLPYNLNYNYVTKQTPE